MGCGGSNVAPPVNHTALVIPVVEGWDGQVFPVIAIPVQLMIQGGFMSVSCSPQPIIQAVGSPQTAGSGYRLTAVFFPVTQTGKQKGQPLDSASAGMMSRAARAMLLFQSDPHEPALPIETLWNKAPLTVTAGIMAQNASGYQGIYGQLQAAGQQGFPLSVIIDEPDVRCNGLFSTQTNVNVVCQRRQGIPVTKQYNVVNCPISIQAGFGGSAASMPTLLPTLQAYVKQGYKVASVYNPPCISQTGFGAAQTACHIVFEKTSVQYLVCCFDVPFQVTASIGSAVVDHNQYISVIQRFTQAGWELAALIDMPDQQMIGLTTFSSTVKLIFQAATKMQGVEQTSPAAVSESIEIDVAVPEGAAPGTMIQVNHPTTGAAFQATVPEGFSPGQTFKMRLG